MGLHNCLFLLSLMLLWDCWAIAAPPPRGFSCNWGTQSTHPLPPRTVVKLMTDNGFTKVKLFEAEPGPLRALGNSGIEVMLGIPNNFLAALASSVTVAEKWVAQNVSAYISKFGVDIRYVAVGNEPFLKTYKSMFLQTTFPALKNVQAALVRAGLAQQVKVTVPLNADVYDSPSGVPSGGDFRPDIRSLMLSIVKFLSQSASPLTINIYPFLSLYADPNFPVDFAFFPDPAAGNSTAAAAPVVDGPITYTNVFDANFDTLVWALEKSGFGSLPVIVGEVGWPTDGDPNATPTAARRFNQGLFNRIRSGQGTPKRPRSPPEVYVFGLIDEDAKSVLPGRFERHWGIFAYDGTIKYRLDIGGAGRRGGGNRTLVPARGVKYLQRRWCVAAPDADLQSPDLAKAVDFACSYADCTSLGLGSSCGKLDARANASYAFNQYFQTMDQRKGACNFTNLSVVTAIDPAGNGCRFEVMIDLRKSEKAKGGPRNSASRGGRRKLRAAAMAVAAVASLWFL